MFAEQVVFPIRIPQRATALPMRQTGIGTDLSRALGADGDTIGVEQLMGRPESDRLVGNSVETSDSDIGRIAQKVGLIGGPGLAELIEVAFASVVVVVQQQEPIIVETEERTG